MPRQQKATGRVAELESDIQALELMILAIVEQHPGVFVSQAQLRRLSKGDYALIVTHLNDKMLRLSIGTKEDAKSNVVKADSRHRHGDNRSALEV